MQGWPRRARRRPTNRHKGLETRPDRRFSLEEGRKLPSSRSSECQEQMQAHFLYIMQVVHKSHLQK